jgi:hypothetical protein
MRIFWAISLLLGTLAWGQDKPVVPTADRPAETIGNDRDEDKAQRSPTTAEVPLDAPVLTIKGFCPAQNPQQMPKQPVAPENDCQTVVTRAEFEKLVDAISPAMKVQAQRQLASAYPRLLVMAHDAEQRGLDKRQRFSVLQRFSRLQILSQEMVREIQQESANVSEKAIENFYRENTHTFERARLERIFVPIRRQAEPLPEEKADDTHLKAQQTESEEAMTKEADKLRVRAAAGEDFTKLQQAAYDAAGIKATATPSDVGKVRRTNLPAAHVLAFDLKVGDLSQVITDASGHYIYKLVSKELPPLDVVKQEIKNTLRERNIQEAMQKIQQSFTTVMNPEFFGGGTPPPHEASKTESVQPQP